MHEQLSRMINQEDSYSRTNIRDLMDTKDDLKCGLTDKKTETESYCKIRAGGSQREGKCRVKQV